MQSPADKLAQALFCSRVHDESSQCGSGSAGNHPQLAVVAPKCGKPVTCRKSSGLTMPSKGAFRQEASANAARFDRGVSSSSGHEAPLPSSPRPRKLRGRLVCLLRPAFVLQSTLVPLRWRSMMSRLLSQVAVKRVNAFELWPQRPPDDCVSAASGSPVAMASAPVLCAGG